MAADNNENRPKNALSQLLDTLKEKRAEEEKNARENYYNRLAAGEDRARKQYENERANVIKNDFIKKLRD